MSFFPSNLTSVGGSQGALLRLTMSELRLIRKTLHESHSIKFIRSSLRSIIERSIWLIESWLFDKKVLRKCMISSPLGYVVIHVTQPSVPARSDSVSVCVHCHEIIAKFDPSSLISVWIFENWENYSLHRSPHNNYCRNRLIQLILRCHHRYCFPYNENFG
jgi:hypothetical protein